jgi:CrcB protein
VIFKLFSVALGGACGAICRFLVGVGALRLFGPFFPVGTMVVNVLGSFIIGYLSIYFMGKAGAGSFLDVFSMIGFLGAFTTFSSFSLETLHLFFNHHWVYAALNVVLNVVLCLSFVGLGVYLASHA